MNNRHTLPRAPSKRHRMAHPWLTAEAYAAIELEAERRGEHVDKLVASMLEKIAADRLFEAVIDGEQTKA